VALRVTIGRNRKRRFGERNGNKQTFVHGDCQRPPVDPFVVTRKSSDPIVCPASFKV